MYVSATCIFKQLLVCCHKSVSHTDVFHWCFICRPNRFRWMRRTRPTHWYRWLPFHRNPLTNPPSRESLRQKTGPTPAPRLMATLTMWPLWLTLRCDHRSYFNSSTVTHPQRTQSMQAPLFAAEITFTCLYKKKKHLHGLEHPDYAHFMLEDPIFLWSSPGSLEYPGFWSQNMMFTYTNTKMGYPKVRSKLGYSSPCKCTEWH